MNNIYITTTLPYVNSDPHIGFAKEIIRADVLARYFMQQGHQVFFNTGTDEHGKKLWDEAVAKEISVEDYVTINAEKFKQLLKELHIHDDIHFIRTTDPDHIVAAQKFWKRCNDAGYIYKGTYSAKYCVGCELEKTDSELVDGKCPLHPTRELELIQEDNYFFAFSKLQDQLTQNYADGKSVVMPAHRQNETTSFIERGLQDFSISRSQEKMPWGIPVPGDETQVMYVWFDALVNYISTLGWPDDEQFKKFWEEGITYQFFGKDNLRQQSLMWQAMLISVGVRPTQFLVDNGFIMGEGGVKMSKSIGNVIAPHEVIEKYGVDALRYMLVRHLSMFEDSDFSFGYAQEWYNAHLVNGIGNLTNRIMKLSETWLGTTVGIADNLQFDTDFITLMEKDMDSQKAYDLVMSWVKFLDTYISENEPFKVIKIDEAQGKEMINYLVTSLAKIAYHLMPLIPQTAEKMMEAIQSNTMPAAPLFERK